MWIATAFAKDGQFGGEIQRVHVALGFVYGIEKCLDEINVVWKVWKKIRRTIGAIQILDHIIATRTDIRPETFKGSDDALVRVAAIVHDQIPTAAVLRDE